MKKPIAALLLLVLTVLACSMSRSPQPTAMPTLVPTSAATQTALPTATAAATNTPLPPTETSDAASGLNPQGKPASEWHGIPIMPEALAGDGDEESYVFTVKATPQQVQEYYDLELGKLGWHTVVAGEGQNSSLILVFTNDASETLSISIIAKEDEALVLLVK